jgi:hypothetical protein
MWMEYIKDDEGRPVGIHASINGEHVCSIDLRHIDTFGFQPPPKIGKTMYFIKPFAGTQEACFIDRCSNAHMRERIDRITETCEVDASDDSSLFDLYDFFPNKVMSMKSSEYNKMQYLSRRYVYGKFCYFYKNVLESSKVDIKTVRRYGLWTRNKIYRYIKEFGLRAEQLCHSFPLLAVFIANVLYNEYPAIIKDQVIDLAGVANSMVMKGKSIKDICQALDMDPIWTRIPPGALSFHLISTDPFQGASSTSPCDMITFNTNIFSRADITDNLRRYSHNWKLYHYRSYIYLISLWADKKYEYQHWVIKHLTEFGKNHREIKAKYYNMKDWAYSKNNRYLTIKRKFSPEMSFKAAKEACDRWHRDIVIAQRKEQEERIEELRAYKFPRQWLPDYEDKGLSIEYINNQGSLLEEGICMSHCVGGSNYVQSIDCGESSIYSIKADGERAATIELVKDGKDIKIRQIQGHGNSRPEENIRSFASQWLAKFKPKAKGKGRCY